MKKQLSLAMAGVMALSLAACGGSSASSAATSTAEAASSTPRAPQRALLLRATFSTRLLPLPSLRMLP